jgi:anti-anti-sigma factor
MCDNDLHSLEPPTVPGRPSVEMDWLREDVVKISLLGEHDLASAGDVETVIQVGLGGAKHVIVDMKEAEFIDSTIIRTLAQGAKQAERAGVGFNLLVDGNSIVKRTLELTDVLSTLHPVESLEEALELDGAGQASTRVGRAGRGEGDGGL